MNDQKGQSDKSEPKLCPFRDVNAPPTVINVEAGQWTSYVPPVGNAEFAPCLEDKCAMWRYLDQDVYSEPGYCGLAGKP